MGLSGREEQSPFPNTEIKYVLFFLPLLFAQEIPIAYSPPPHVLHYLADSNLPVDLIPPSYLPENNSPSFPNAVGYL